MQILDIKALDNKEEIEQRFKHLFEINEKEKGGTLYMQSKVSLSCLSIQIFNFKYLGVQSQRTNRCRINEAGRDGKARGKILVC